MRHRAIAQAAFSKQISIVCISITGAIALRIIALCPKISRCAPNSYKDNYAPQSSRLSSQALHRSDSINLLLVMGALYS